MNGVAFGSNFVHDANYAQRGVHGFSSRFFIFLFLDEMRLRQLSTPITNGPLLRGINGAISRRPFIPPYRTAGKVLPRNFHTASFQ
jgi:hypothetical protein